MLSAVTKLATLWAVVSLLPPTLSVRGIDEEATTTNVSDSVTVSFDVTTAVTAVGDATGAAGDGEAGTCVSESSGDEELHGDPRWLCAAGRALCLSKHLHIDDERCNTVSGLKICSNLSENSSLIYSSVIDDTEMLIPKLECRTTSSLQWHWEVPDTQLSSPGVFVVSIRQFDKTWLLHDVVSEDKYAIDNLPPDTKFQIRTQLITDNGSFVGPCFSKWISTLNVNFYPLQVRNAKVADKYDFSADHVNMSLQWEPNEEDMACDYKVVYWDLKVQSDSLHEISPIKKFSALLPNLNFDSSYRAYVISGDQKIEKWGDEKATVNIMTPCCLDVWNNNISICSPPPPAILPLTFLKVGDVYDINISWIPAKIFPERYNVSITRLSSRPVEEYTFVDGNSTYAIFKNAKYNTFYRVCVTAMSSGGNSERNCTLQKFRLQGNKKSEFGEITVVIIVSLIVPCMIMLIILFLCYHYNKKRRENVTRCEYFKNLEKEIPNEKEYEPTILYFDDEWEVEESRLAIGKVLGEGAFGIVHEGVLQGKTRLESAKKVAVKVLRDHSHPESIYQFQKEIAMMKSVGTHPHIVSIIGCCTHSKQVRLIVEYCALGNLRNYLHEKAAQYAQNINRVHDKPTESIKYAELMLADGGDADFEYRVKTNIAVNQMYFQNCVKKEAERSILQPVDLLSFARQIAIGMEFLSSNRIVHRDLAARNVLVCSDKTVKISDFGLSKDIYEQNVYLKKGSGKIPVLWTAFESLKYHRYTTQSDVWSFGILLWEIVTLGEMPYPGIPVDKIFQYLKNGYRMECPPNCSKELYDIMQSCWRIKPKDRPTFRELHNKLDIILETTSPQQYLRLNTTDDESFEMCSSVNEPFKYIASKAPN